MGIKVEYAVDCRKCGRITFTGKCMYCRTENE